MQPWMIWLIVGLVLLIVELSIMSLFLLWIAVGAFIAGIVAIFVPTVWVQWLVFGVSSLILLIATRPFARSVHATVTTPSNVDALIGARAMVIETIDPLENMGRVRIGSDEWRARSDEAIPADSWAEVTGVKGATLLVKPFEQERDEPEGSTE